MLCLLPHTSHETQPLDCGVFGPLKRHWMSTCHNFFQSNPGKVVTKFNFNSLFSQAWLKAVSPSNVIAGFKTCGVHPFNPSAIKVPEANLKKTASESPHSDAIATAARPDPAQHTQEFTEEQVQLFQKRVEEGYDLYTDPAYVS